MDAQSTAQRFDYSISKRFEFVASHQLKKLIGTTLPDGREHPCARRHGHNYVIEIVLRGTSLDENGFLLDYHGLAPLKQMLEERFDHRDLNDVLAIDNPTSEVLARRILRWAILHWPKHDVEISVEETPKTRATVRSAAHTGDDFDVVQLGHAFGVTLSTFCGLDSDQVGAFAAAAYYDGGHPV